MKILFLGISFLLGLCREFLVIRYQHAIIKIKPLPGALATVGIGLQDLVMLLALIELKRPDMFISYVFGEAVATFFGIKYIRAKQ